LNKPLTVGALRRRIAAQLGEAFAARRHEGPPALDARMLIAQALGMPPSEVPLHDDDTVSAEVEAAAGAFAARRAEGEPVARINGYREFHGLKLALSPDTLEPRPDTETLVDAVLAARGMEEEFSILDLGTGTGAILLSILAERPRASGIGVDIASGALKTAEANAGRLGLASRAQFVSGDWAKKINGPFDVVVSNPPYVESGAIAALPVDVRDFDPHVALDGGRDGLDAVRAIVADLDRIMAREGEAFVEIGNGQSGAARALAESSGFAVRTAKDLAGIERVVMIKRR
jgi:release factor glutamine methyltransferase